MTGGWKRKENQKQVSLPFPPALEIAGAIPTFPPPQRLFSFTKKEAQTKAPLPHFAQAHSSMRICWGPALPVIKLDRLTPDRGASKLRAEIE